MRTLTHKTAGLIARPPKARLVRLTCCAMSSKNIIRDRDEALKVGEGAKPRDRAGRPPTAAVPVTAAAAPSPASCWQP
jgi:hypothetical protein